MCLLLAIAFTLSTAARAETRTLHLFNAHTKERVDITFKKNGKYIPSGLRDANRFLRDWRRNEMTTIDPELLDLVWEVYQQVGAKSPIHVVSSYRSPATNGMLRSRSSGVAKNSQHMRGKAMDFFIPGVNLATLRATGLRKQVGGVGYYPTSGSPFVHMDTGSVRHWPRMTRSQLAKVFPDGRTLHVPTDGKPLSGYQLALSDEKAGRHKAGGRSSGTLLASASDSPAPARNSTRGQSLSNSGSVIRPGADVGGEDEETEDQPSFLASLFGSGKNTPAQENARVAAVRSGDSVVPPGAVPGVRNSGDRSSPATAAAPAIVAPPVPVLKEKSEPEAAPSPEAPVAPTEVPAAIAIASVLPSAKPALARPAPVQVAFAPNTLDAQRVRMENSGPATTPAQEAASGTRFNVADAVPGQKPSGQLLAATQRAAAQATVSGNIPVPASAPANDPVAAILAATGKPTVGRTNNGLAPETLAYASATLTPAAVAASAKKPAATAKAHKPGKEVARSVSGRIPTNQIKDPLSGFAGLPDKSAPMLLSSDGTMRNVTLASLSHPRQRVLGTFLEPGNRFVAGGFGKFPYGALRTDRFDGPAVIVLPVTFAR
ncbi:Uncharacterized conserved protein YcbK, DUF882 family [Roseibium suaedae]|uniref:Murein endopeptidase K n=1 Tax=Roseibium suaedae TaxID=735517 RepID=A0A1M7IUY0_9HYPH|nr:DUF882 domain-containing protein [Roseibium suaedae]SHM44574.1 Uncharacterized conserved protein YcbK, DUF882 family [Roseibium suaedae]